MSTESPDWVRLHKALAVEAERGFTDLVGKQYRFSEFLSLSFANPSYPVARKSPMAGDGGSICQLSSVDD